MNRQTLSYEGPMPRLERLRLRGLAKHAKLSAGFTLVELMVTLSLLAIIVGFAVPGMQSLVTSYRISTLANEFTAGLAHTRGEAVNRNMCTTMCISGNTTAANPTCSGTINDWSQGWIIFADPDCNGGASGPRDQLLQVYEGRDSGPRLFTQGNRRSVSFISRGTLGGAGAADVFLIDTGGNSPVLTKRLCMDMAGRVRVGNVDLLLNCN